MVQIIPRNELGTNLGQALGGGLGQGIEQGANIGLQRHLIQNALGDLTNLPKNATPLQLASSLIKATAGIPGAERYVGQLFPLLLQQTRLQGLTQEGQPFGAPGAGGQPSMTPGAPTQPSEGKGFLGKIYNPEEIQNFARNYAIQMGDPNAYEQGFNIATSLNQQARTSRTELAQRAQQELGVPQDEIADVTRILEKYGNLPNPDAIIQAARPEIGRFRNLKTKLDQAFVPGVVSGIAQKGGFGVLGNLLTANRDKTLRELHGTVKELIDMGFEPMVRNKLASEHLSPTEVEEAIHPLSKSTSAAINNFPSSSKIPADKRQDRISGFIKDTLKHSPDTSLLVLRHKLWDEKGYDWKEIANAINQPDITSHLSDAQKAELLTVENDPPVQSLTDIFRGYGRWIDYLRGTK